MELISVNDAHDIIDHQRRDFGVERIPTVAALGRTLAEDVRADRDLPPFDRVTMDGIAICFKKACLSEAFHLQVTQAAGEPPCILQSADQCIEVMTGAVLPVGTDTVVPYEWLQIEHQLVRILTPAKVIESQNIHFKGKDARQHDVLIKMDTPVTASVIQVLAAVGKRDVLVYKLPKVILLSTGDELVDIADVPKDYQIRRSSNYALVAQLQQYGINTVQKHLVDEETIIQQAIADALQAYDIVLLTGGVSKGKFDFIPFALEKAGVRNLFHGVRQRPGKPFWFGVHRAGALVFAFPGNPVSTQLCVQRYFLPWLQAHVGRKPVVMRYAKLREEVTFEPALDYFLQVTLATDNQGQTWATPCTSNGSGDFANLIHADAFLALPAAQSAFKTGDVFPYWLIHS